MGKITIDEMHNSLFDYAQAVSDENLMTENKTIVGAINEIYGKNLIADSIGEPLNNTDTYTKMSNDINSLLSTFKTNMMNAGVVVESSDKFKQLIDKIVTMSEEGNGKGIKFASGECKLYGPAITNAGSGVTGDQSFTFTTDIPINIDFEPTYVFCLGDFDFRQNVYNATYDESVKNSILVNDVNMMSSENKKNGSTMFVNISSFDSNKITITSRLFVSYYNPVAYAAVNTIYGWYAIGVGEEDTTLRDSLASILQDEGVEVTEEDDMASLISKTDNEFQENTTILYNKMKDANYNVDSSMNMDALLNELTFKTIIEGKVAQSPSTSENSLVYSVSGLDFTPSLVYVTLKGVYEQSDEIESVYYNSITLNNRQSFVGESKYNTIKVNIKNNGFNLVLNSQDGSAYTGSLGWTSINGISYVAIR